MIYWLLTTEYPPFFGGGISTYCLHTATMLTEKGYAVSVFVNDASVKKIEVTENEGIRVIRFNPTATKESFYLGHVTSISYEFAHIVKYFIEKEGKPDIIESQEYLGIAYYLLQYKKMCYSWCNDVPVIITMHSPSFLYMEYNHVSEYRYPNYWICEMERFCLQAADHVISPSKYMVAELGKRFQLEHNNISVIPNPFKFNEKQRNVDFRRPGEIVFYGKLTAQKGTFQLLLYFKQLWDNGLYRSLTLVGGQDIVYHPEGRTMGDIIRKRYKKYIALELLRLEDRIKPTQISERLQSAELVIIPSNNDNLPYVVAEMMSLGKIVLVSKQGGHSEVVDHTINGFVFDHEYPETFIDQIKKILSLEKGTLLDVSNNAIKRVETFFNYEKVFQDKHTVVKTLINNQTGYANEFPYIRRSIQKTIVAAEITKSSKLSVVIPFYNLGLYLNDAVQSVKKSSYADKEIIIVNDGSTDKLSLQVLDNLRNDPDVRIIDAAKSGIAKTRNTGATVASGKYLAFLDADDKVEPDYYLKAISVLNNYNNVHFVGCWIKYFGDSGKIWPAFNPEPPLILYHNLINSSSLVYKRISFLEHGKNDSYMLFQGWEDYESVVSMIANGSYGVVLPEPLFQYRIRQDSMVRELSKAKKILLHQYISQKHKEIFSNFTVDLFNLQNANGPSLEIDNPSLDYHLSDNIPWKGKSAQKIIRIIKKNKQAKKIVYKLYSLIKK